MRNSTPHSSFIAKSLKVVFFTFFSASIYAQTPIVFSPAVSGQTFNTCNGFIIDAGGQGGQDIQIMKRPSLPYAQIPLEKSYQLSLTFLT